MDYHENTLVKTASSDMSKGTLVLLDSTDSSQIDAAAATSANAIGSILDDVDSGDTVTVALLGLTNNTIPAIASKAITVGAKVYLAASGKVQPISTTAGTYYCIGIALTEATADGDLIEVSHRATQSEIITA